MRQSKRYGAPIWVTLALSVWIWAVPSTSFGQCVDVTGDVDGSGAVNVADVQCAILATLYELSGGADAGLIDCLAGDIFAADVSCNGQVDIIDVVMSIAFTFGAPLGVVADYNGNACPNACDLSPTEPGALEPLWELLDYQPESPGFGQTYGLGSIDGVTLVALLDSG